MRAIFLLTIVALALAVDVRQQFIDFQQTYGRSYATQQEFDHRFAIFKDNLKRNEELMQLNPQATFGINKFADLSKQEFTEQYLMDIDMSTYVAPPPVDFSVKRPENVRQCSPDPTNFNWQDCGSTTPIYNQGQCGSCWAFSATETIESYYYLGGGQLTSLAVQQIVSCDTTSSGCSGGWPSSAYSYIQSTSGIETWNSYPYTSEQGYSGECSYSASQAAVQVTSTQTVSGETGLYQQTSSSSGGPVSVCVDASTWSSYTGGVMTSCGSDIDHCVQLVGYSNYGNNGSYWIVRNQWGQDWGENGLIYIEIGQDLCAIGDAATIVTAGSA